MKVLCIRPKELAGLYFGRTYTCVETRSCKHCNKSWLFIVEAQHMEPWLGQNEFIAVCSNCEWDVELTTKERERHMFGSYRFMGIESPITTSNINERIEA